MYLSLWTQALNQFLGRNNIEALVLPMQIPYFT